MRELLERRRKPGFYVVRIVITDIESRHVLGNEIRNLTCRAAGYDDLARRWGWDCRSTKTRQILDNLGESNLILLVEVVDGIKDNNHLQIDPCTQ